MVSATPPPTLALELLDLSSVSIAEARQAVIEDGMRLIHPPQAPCFILLAGGLAVRVRLEESDGNWKARSDTPGMIRTWEVPPALVIGDASSGRRFLAELPTVQGNPRELNWTPDRELLARIIREMKKLRPEWSSWEHGREMTERLTAHLDRAGMLKFPSAWTDAAARLPHLKSNLIGNMISVDEVVAALESLKPVSERLALDVEFLRQKTEADLRAELEPVIRAGIERQHADLTAGLDELRSRVVEARREGEFIAAKAAEAQAALASMRSVIAVEAGELREEFATAPREASRAIRRLAGKIASAAPGLDGMLLYPPEAPPWAVTADGGECGLVRPGDRGRLLDETAGSLDVDPSSLKVLDALLRAGEPTVLVGEAWRLPLDAYALVTAGGRVHRMFSDPTLLSVDDLWRQPATGSPTAFAHAWVAARARPDEAVLVVLERVQASPFGLWLPALRTVLEQPARPRNLFVACRVDGPCGSRHLTGRGIFRSMLAMLPPAETAGTRMASLFRTLGLGPGILPKQMIGLAASGPADAATQDICHRLAIADISNAANAVRAVRIAVAASVVMPVDAAIALAVEAFGSSCGTDNRFEKARKALDDILTEGEVDA